mgnify:CR=1 FL=1
MSIVFLKKIKKFSTLKIRMTNKRYEKRQLTLWKLQTMQL